jgi:hypothetical protein
MSEAASTRRRVTHFQVVRNFTNSADPFFTTTTKPGVAMIEQRHQVIDFLPSAVLGEANNFVVVKSIPGASQGKRQEADGLPQRFPMKLRERKLLPLGRYWNGGVKIPPKNEPAITHGSQSPTDIQ